MLWLAGLFGVVALVYASVGFGGGSTYTALLALWGVDYRLIPVIALFCNIIVVTGGSIRFVRAGLVSWPQVLPLLLISAPLAFAGGTGAVKTSRVLNNIGRGFVGVVDRPLHASGQDGTAQRIQADVIGHFRRCWAAGGSVGHRWRHIHGTCLAPHPLGRGAPDRGICIALYSDKLGRGAIWPNH